MKRRGPSRFSRRPGENFQLDKAMIKAIIRHVASAIGAGAAGWLTAGSGMDIGPEGITTIILALYATFEKSGKKITGES